MQRRYIAVINKLGLHARAAAKLVRLAGRFESQISLLHNGQEADAKSIMGLMMLAATQGAILEVITAGGDEAEAMAAVVDLFNDRFGEGE